MEKQNSQWLTMSAGLNTGTGHASGNNLQAHDKEAEVAFQDLFSRNRSSRRRRRKYGSGFAKSRKSKGGDGDGGSDDNDEGNASG